jgi:putative copper export protein
MRKSAALRLGIGIVLFAILMGVRPAVSTVWLRALLAGCAFVVLLVAIGLASRARRTPEQTARSDDSRPQ